MKLKSSFSVILATASIVSIDILSTCYPGFATNFPAIVRVPHRSSISQQIPLSTKPLSTTDYYNRGVSRFVKGNYVGAIADFDRATAIDPKWMAVYYSRALAKSELKDYPGVVADLNRAIALDTGYAGAYQERGMAKSVLGDYQGAIKDFDRTIVINPKHAGAYNGRGVAKSALGDQQGAIADWERAVALKPNYQAPADNLRKAKNAAERANAPTTNPSPIAQKTKTERTDFTDNFTSISQFKDVKPTDKYYFDLKILTEHYGVTVAYKDGKFHPEISLSRGQFAIFLNNGLNRIAELSAVSNVKEGIEFGSPLKFRSVVNQFSAKTQNITSVSQIKDLNSESPYFLAVKSLTERFGIDLVDTDGMLRPEKPVTEQELESWLKGIFKVEIPLPRNSPGISASKIVDRGQFVERFALALNWTKELMDN